MTEATRRGVLRVSACLALLAGAAAGPLSGQDAAGTVDGLLPAVGAQAGPVRDTLPFCCDQRKFAPAALEVALLQVVPWYFNRHFAHDSSAVVSLDSWWRNIEQGFEWDVDNFRTNGYGFWESVAFPWLGSFLFEFFGEKNRPSINDWTSTSHGGVVVGEALFRTSRAILDNRATGSERAFRELAAFLVNPVGGINRLFRGEMSRVGPNPEDRLPEGVSISTKLGFRVVGEGNLRIEDGGANPFLEATAQFGDPFGPLEQPFEDFVLTVQINDKDKEVLGRLGIEGPIFRTSIGRAGEDRHFFGLRMHYDYINNETYELGGQSVSAGITSQLRLTDTWTLRGRAQLVGSIIAGVGSEYADVTGRSYDLGSGAGVRVYGTLYRGRDPLVEAFYVGAWIYSLDGASGNHAIHFPSLTVKIPVRRPVGLGAEVLFAARNSFYRDFPDVHRRNPQFRLFTTLMP